ncbi:hypothetical protein SAMN03159437_04896 [Pseudomonas sp. NFACC25]|nr:hypothetical protein SAMN03159437_04896 [Pseudomonas sp. NFACC25]
MPEMKTPPAATGGVGGKSRCPINVFRPQQIFKLRLWLHVGKLSAMLWPSLQIQRPGLATRVTWRTSAPSDSRRFFCARRFVLWRLCVGDLRVCRVPSSRFANLRTAATLIRLATISGSSTSNLELYLCALPIRPKSVLLPTGQWLAPLYTQTPASVPDSPATTLTWKKHAPWKPQGV